MGFRVNAVLQGKPDARDENQESCSKRTVNQSGLKNVANSNIGASGKQFDSAREIVERSVAKPKYGDEQFREMMDRRIAVGWDIGKLYKVAELRNETFKETENFENENVAYFSVE